MLKEKIEAVLNEGDRELFRHGYDCEKGTIRGEWGTPPASPPNNVAPAYLLGRIAFIGDEIRAYVPRDTAVGKIIDPRIP